MLVYPPPPMHVAAYQFDAAPGAVAENLRRIAHILHALTPGELDVLLFPEMCDTGYAMDVIVREAVPWSADHLADIRALAAKKRVNVLIGLSERVDRSIYNTVAVIDAGGALVHKYRKTHLVSIQPIEEHRHLTPGDALGVFPLAGTTAGVVTCYELRFPEVARTLTLRGAQVLFVPAAWPHVRVDHLLTLLRARAIENQVFVVSACRVGTDAGTRFSGHSLIIDPNGTILARGTETGEALLRASLDLEEVGRSRARIGALGERRVDLYD